jgi:hypothetical protein
MKEGPVCKFGALAQASRTIVFLAHNNMYHELVSSPFVAFKSNVVANKTVVVSRLARESQRETVSILSPATQHWKQKVGCNYAHIKGDAREMQ